MTTMIRKKIYVSGPITGSGSVKENVKNAMYVGDQLMYLGYAPLIPHLSVYWDEIYPQTYDDWMSLDLAWLSVADACLRITGDSPGADAEEEFAIRHNIPIFFNLKDLYLNFLPAANDKKNFAFCSQCGNIIQDDADHWCQFLWGRE